MKVLVIGGMHGNETLGIRLVELLNARKIKNVDAIIANKPALEKNARFINSDLNRSFPGCVNSTSSHEERRAGELREMAKKYDVVLDFHNTFCPNNDCTFIGESSSPVLEKVAVLFKLTKMIVVDYDCINKYVPNCISIEVSMDSSKNSEAYWYKKIAQLANGEESFREVDVEKYRFVYRMTLEDRDRLTLDKLNLQAFQPLPQEVASKLGLTEPAYPIFIGDKFTPYNYGGLLYRV